MAKALVITPVKNSIETTLETAAAIQASTVPVTHKIFNDFSSPETKALLDQNAPKIGYELVHLEEITDTPSPNYKLVLQMAQKEAVAMQLPLLVVESDVTVEKDTIEKMLQFLQDHENTGLVGAITVGYDQKVNFPYLKFKDVKDAVIDTKRSLSFCCTLFSPAFLAAYDFMQLDESKDWYDTFISKKAIEMGYQNYVMMDAPVLHKPHGSRPWKQLKYKNPLKYYFLKFWKGMDKI
ncbi:glycosyltransferase family 2 protein [Echinicola vietnamensis]|uniref:Putative glycosyltransferase n=1 Tax=Echinicola vietnamensis (strain DSM 17526 / LMG 23754 / KMM 6221) TaxID=926556 RepID=L0FVA0_ECHVK|nr:glycosyltransferase [Echinicola vietnamensis]AGA76953.1 putative glycosyltransferase [Echinicola vietnamensis DSM 17526]